MAVRREKVVLELEDHFSNQLTRSIAATKAFEATLDDLDKTSKRTDGSQRRTSQSVDQTGRSAARASREIDRYSGRLRLAVDAVLALGPAAVSTGALALPALAGIAAQLGAIALAGGTAIVAFSGVGDALTAVNDAAIDPTTKNLVAARDALEQLGPHAQQFVGEMQRLRPTLDGFSDAAGAGLFPGLVAAFDRLDAVAPRLEGVLEAIGGATGDLVDDFAAGVSGSRGMAFLEFIRTEVPDALTELGATMGNFTAGLAELWMAFTPLNRDFSSWLLDASRGFDEWAQGLAQTEGFEEFVDYIRTNGPQVADAAAAIGDALVSIVTAAAPLGGPVLAAVESIASLVAAIAGSPAGPGILAAFTAMTLLTRSTATFGRVAESSWGQAVRGQQGAIAQMSAYRQAALQGAAGVAGLSLSMIDLRDSTSKAAQGFDTLSGVAGQALLGFAVGGPVGGAVGAGIGLITELTSATHSLDAALRDADDAMASMDIEEIRAALTGMNTELARQNGLSDFLELIPVAGVYLSAWADDSEEVERAQRKLNVALATAEGRTTGLEAAMLGARKAGLEFTAAQGRQTEKLRQLRQAAGQVASDFIDLANNADKAKVSLGQWLRQLERQADALRDFRINAEQAAEKGLRRGLIEELQELGPVGALRMRQLANATDREIDRANAAWKEAQRQTRLYKDSIENIPEIVRTKVNVEDGAAIGAIAGIVAKLNGIEDETVNVYIKTHRSAAAGAALGLAVPGAAAGEDVPDGGPLTVVRSA